MKTFLVVLFAGAMVTAGALASSDGGAEERFRMKFGRNTPAEEARQQAAKQAKAQGLMACVKEGCCPRLPPAVNRPSLAANRNFGAEARFRAKFGRSMSAVEVSGAPSVATARNNAGFEERFQMKFGRNTPAEEERLPAAQRPTEPVLLAAAGRCGCGNESCRHAH